MLFIVKITLVWIIMVLAAILNGLARDKLVAPFTDPSISLFISGITLSILVYVISYFCIPVFGRLRSSRYFIIGFCWVSMTLAFEYLFGYFVAGKSWNEIHEVFNPMNGNLFLLVLCITAVSPWLTARFRKLL